MASGRRKTDRQKAFAIAGLAVLLFLHCMAANILCGVTLYTLYKQRDKDAAVEQFFKAMNDYMEARQLAEDTLGRPI